MKLKPTGQRAGAPNPFQALTEHPDPDKPPVTGAGIGADRKRPGLGLPRSAKRRRWDAEALGATPPRDGPFANSAEAVTRMMPVRKRVDPRSKQTGVDPFGTLAKAHRKAQ
jgi:hypothetical protein